MSKEILYVGIDVDDQGFSLAGVSSQTGEEVEARCKPNRGALVKQLQKMSKLGYAVHCCYEATYIGFSLVRELAEDGYPCEVVASSLIPQVPGQRQKTNRIDARKLAQYFKQGMLTMVHVPEEEDEQVRDVIRARGFVVDQRKRSRRYLLAMCRRMGMHYRQSVGRPEARHWTQRHRVWLEAEIARSGREVFQVNLRLQLEHLYQLDNMIEAYDAEIERRSQETRYQAPVQALMCFRGIDRLTAMTLHTELGDIRRFPHPRPLTSYVGFDIVEYSSGTEKKFGISHRGNRVLRTALVETVQCAHRRPRVSEHLQARRVGRSPDIIATADRCMRRMYQKSRRLQMRGKHSNKVKVACAREMLGFLWEALHQAAA